MSFRFTGIDFGLEDGDDFGYFLAFGGVALPTSFNRLPNAIREFRVVRTSRSMSVQH